MLCHIFLTLFLWGIFLDITFDLMLNSKYQGRSSVFRATFCVVSLTWLPPGLLGGCRWLNTLGMAAVQGIDVVLRHSLFDYGYTHLVDQHFNPLPVSLSPGVQGLTLRDNVSRFIYFH